MKGLGTVVNVLAIVAGGSIGAIFRGKIKVKYQELVVQACGLVVMVVGLFSALNTLFVFEEGQLEADGSMLMILALLVGSAFGWVVDVERMLSSLGRAFKRLMTEDATGASVPSARSVKASSASRTRKGRRSLAELPTYDMLSPRSGDLFVDGFVIATLLVSVSALGLSGAIEDGLTGTGTTLYIKAVLDLVLMLALSFVYGKGVALAAVPALVVEGGLTLVAIFAGDSITQALTDQLAVIGSVMLVTVGLNLAFGKKFKAANMIPSFFIPVLYHSIVTIVQHAVGK